MSQAIYAEHRDYVLRWLVQVGLTLHDAEDAAQDIFLRVHLQWAELADVANWRAWLHVVATRTAISYRRKARYKRELLSASSIEAASDSGGVADSDDDYVALDAALDALPAPMRKLLMAYYFDQVPAKKLAELTARPLPTIYARLKSARLHAARHVRRCQLHNIGRAAQGGTSVVNFAAGTAVFRLARKRI